MRMDIANVSEVLPANRSSGLSHITQEKPRTIFGRIFGFKFPGWSEYFGLAVMSIAAPYAAAMFHSLAMIESGHRYNAEIGGAPSTSQSTTDWVGVTIWIVSAVLITALPALPLFLVLVKFRRDAFLRWVSWFAYAALWLVLLYNLMAL